MNLVLRTVEEERKAIIEKIEFTDTPPRGIMVPVGIVYDLQDALTEMERLQGLVDREAATRVALTDCNEAHARLTSANRRLHAEAERLEQHVVDLIGLNTAEHAKVHKAEQRYQRLLELAEPLLPTVDNS
ncbi:hypothetical protein LCGC14_0312780 [marine sediment metagenome]|uniref:Uncharacterized protein n=1 Tax=marine sediment metagenome TaxID=412755 RepID=A0A0F9W8L5_9ZZZZ